jgi:F-type H+-transporting ATPase subunit g
MSMSSSRAMLRQVGKVSGRRFQSSSANKATETAKNVAQDYKSKASEGLSKVQSAAGPAISGAVKGVTNTLNKIGGRTGRLISFVQST